MLMFASTSYLFMVQVQFSVMQKKQNKKQTKKQQINKK